MREAFAMIAVTAAAAVSVSACTGPLPDTSIPGESSAAATSPSLKLPNRPREIDLVGVDTCTLLSTEQQQKLGTDVPPQSSSDTDDLGNKYCDYGKIQSSPRFGYTVKVVTQEDATIYLTKARNATARVTSAAGFPAVEAHRPTDDRGCFVLVSTKDGQYLSVQYGESTGSNDSTEVACEKARVAAEMATQTLLTQR